MRQKGWESERPKECSTYEYRLSNSVSRARAKLFEYAICNDFQFFFTGTFRDEDVRKDYVNASEKFLTFVKNYKYRRAPDLIAVFVLEKDKNGNYHFHGLIGGIPPDDLALNEHNYLDWLPFVKRFGFCSLSQIRDKLAVSKYITKYLTKDFGNDIPKGKHLYFRFGNLKRSIEVFRGTFDMRDYVYDYYMENTKVKILHQSDIVGFIDFLCRDS